MGSKEATSHIAFAFFGYSDSGKTRRYVVSNIQTEENLGEVKWAGNFRKYAFFPAPYTFYDSRCLRSIANFCDNLTKEHKETKNEDSEYSDDTK